MSTNLIRTVALQPQVRVSLEDLLAHFFVTLLEECPACGSQSCERWQLVRELAPPPAQAVRAVAGAEVLRG
jgi:hypothetical protein